MMGNQINNVITKLSNEYHIGLVEVNMLVSVLKIIV